MHIFHKWSVWKDTQKGNIVMYYPELNGKPSVTGTFLIQERICYPCGKKELRTVRTYLI